MATPSAEMWRTNHFWTIFPDYLLTVIAVPEGWQLTWLIFHLLVISVWVMEKAILFLLLLFLKKQRAKSTQRLSGVNPKKMSQSRIRICFCSWNSALEHGFDVVFSTLGSFLLCLRADARAEDKQSPADRYRGPNWVKPQLLALFRRKDCLARSSWKFI